jgi:predicted anti-sigma-YlaC factor YlaD
MTCADSTMSLGVYLLGALSADEQAEVETHLIDCAQCRAELADLAALPELLGRLSLSDIAAEPPAVPDDLFERVADRARAEAATAARSLSARVHRRYRLIAVAAAAVLLLVVGGGTWEALRPHPHVFTTASGQVHMSVQVASQTTGTGFALTVSGLRKDEHCTLIAVATDGSRDVAGRWDATYDGQANVTGSTSIPQSQLSRLVLLGTGGHALATVNV